MEKRKGEQKGGSLKRWGFDVMERRDTHPPLLFFMECVIVFLTEAKRLFEVKYGQLQVQFFSEISISSY